MSEDIVDKIQKRYGFLGLFMFVLCLAITAFLWVVAVAVYIWPVFLPIIASAYMIWSLRK